MIPNLKEGGLWGRVYTFHSQGTGVDGEPFTADDFMFWYEDVALNKELTPTFPAWLILGRAGGPRKVDTTPSHGLPSSRPAARFLCFVAKP